MRGLTIIIAIYYLGLWLTRLIPYPVPGSILGMLILFLLLKIKWIPINWVDGASTMLLALLGLFFVPYGVGIIESYDDIRAWSMSIIFIAVLTTILVLVVSALVFTFLRQKIRK